jgi:hippurate hydrolase
MHEDWLLANHSRFTEMRRDLHQHPELEFDEHRTSALVIAELTRLGYEVTTGLGKTGVVGTLKRGKGNRAIAIRADMDALPIAEETGLAWASKNSGKMHACGHDGHTTCLLAAAGSLALNGRFDGQVHLIFQPAEEGAGGAYHMVKDGLFERFPVEGVFAFHNLPGLALGQIKTRPGPITARIDIGRIRVTGKGGHGAMPHLATDPVVAGASIIMALQTAISRNLNAIDVGVLTVGGMHGAGTATIIPACVDLPIGLRTVTPEATALLRERVVTIARQQAESFGCHAEIEFEDEILYPPCQNDPALAAAVSSVAASLGQLPETVELAGPYMFSEDFSSMLAETKGCFLTIGNGDSHGLHDPRYDFNDDLIPKAAAFWCRLVEMQLPA